jgi:hypothetical protein
MHPVRACAASHGKFQDQEKKGIRSSTVREAKAGVVARRANHEAPSVENPTWGRWFPGASISVKVFRLITEFTKKARAIPGEPHHIRVPSIAGIYWMQHDVATMSSWLHMRIDFHTDS